MEHYQIRFSFRGNPHSAHVQDFGDYKLVNFSSQDILNDFTGTIKFENDKHVLGYVRNKDAKDLKDLLSAVEKQLR